MSWHFLLSVKSFKPITKCFVSTSYAGTPRQSCLPQLRLGVSGVPIQTCAHRRCHHIVQGQNSASCREGQRNLPVPQHWASADTAAPWYERKSASSGEQSAVLPEIKQMWMKKYFWTLLGCQQWAQQRPSSCGPHYCYVVWLFWPVGSLQSWLWFHAGCRAGPGSTSPSVLLCHRSPPASQ